jgi:hypothetical protein
MATSGMLRPGRRFGSPEVSSVEASTDSTARTDSIAERALGVVPSQVAPVTSAGVTSAAEADDSNRCRS